MPATSGDYQDIEKKQKQARELSRQSGQVAAGATEFEPNVWDKIRQARASRGVSELDTARGQAVGSVAGQGQVVRDRLRGQVDPTSIVGVTAGDRAANLGQLSAVTSAQQGITGTLSDIIGGGTDRLKAAAMAKRSEAGAASQEANDMIQMLKLQEAKEQQDFEQWLAKQQLGISRARLGQEDTTTEENFNAMARGYLDQMAQGIIEPETAVNHMMREFPDVPEDQIRLALGGIEQPVPEQPAQGGGNFLGGLWGKYKNIASGPSQAVGNFLGNLFSGGGRQQPQVDRNLINTKPIPYDAIMGTGGVPGIDRRWDSARGKWVYEDMEGLDLDLEKFKR